MLTHTALPITMQTLLRVVLFCGLLAVGSTWKCETCTGQGKSCTGRSVICLTGEDYCVNIWLELALAPEGRPAETMTKGCSTKSACDNLKFKMQKVLQHTGSVITNVECRLVRAASGSLPQPFLLAFSELLFMMLLF